MKNANGYGTIKKLSGKRRRPYAVLVTDGYDVVEQNGVTKVKQVQKPIGYYASRVEAQKALALYNIDPYNFNVSTVNWNALYDLWLERATPKISAGTLNNYKSQWNKLNKIDFKERIVKDETTLSLQKIINELCTTEPQKNSMKIFLSQLYTEAMIHDVVAKDYSKYLETSSSGKVNRKKKPSALTFDQVNNFFKLNDTCAKIFIVATFTGLRIGELFNLNRVNVDFKKRTINIVKSKTKSGIRIVPISKHIIPIFKELYGDKNFILETRTGKPITEASFYKYHFNVWREQNNFENTPHDCRHTFATWCKKAQVQELTRKRMMGHSVRDFTDNFYTTTDYDDLMNAINIFDKFVEENLLLICYLRQENVKVE